MGDTESCDSRDFEPVSTQGRKRRHKVEVFQEIVRKLRELNNEEASQPGFEDELWAHFNRLPSRYAADVDVERAEEVLMHKNLLHRAYDPTTGLAFELVPIIVPPPDLSSGDSVHSKSITKLDPQTSDWPPRQSLPPLAFGLSPNLELALEANKSNGRIRGDGKLPYFRHLYEITISTIDKPKILSRLTSLLSEIGLNIQEAHAFSTSDGYSLDVFVVEDQSHEEMEQLRNVLEKNLSGSKNNFKSPVEELRQTGSELNRGHVKIPTDGIDVWEIDLMLLKFDHLIAPGPCKELYRGTYGSQDVAIKALKAEYLNADVQREFFQEVYILRRVRHKNVVQFIGACTNPPNLCIVTEYMSRGSVYDYMHKHKGIFMLPALLKVAIDVSRGMNYLHQNNIVHRDLKAANLLMDENEVVKVADFGVAKVQTSGVMTSETGTYRWMAPEVIEHKPYDRKADVFSFGIVLWELLTGKIPYEHLTPLQAAVGVVQKGLRPLVPTNTHPMMVELLESCWQQDPYSRPEFSEIMEILLHMAHEVTEEEKAVKRRCYVGETSIKQENEVNG